MISVRKLKRSFLFLLSLSLLMLFFGSGITFLLRRQNEPSGITKRISREILASERQLKEELEKISQNFQAGSLNDRGKLESEYRNYFEKEGVVFLIYRDNHLYAWTDNNFQAPTEINPEFTTQSFLTGSNGYYLKTALQKGHWTFVGLQLVKYRYKFSNDYLTEEFLWKFHAPPNSGISFKPAESNIYSGEGKFLFSLTFENEIKPGTFMLFLVFIIYVAGFLLLVAALMPAYFYVYRFIRNRWLMLLFLTLDVAILRALQFYFRFPAFLYDSELFSPLWYASSELLPSLGDLLLNTLLAFQLSYMVFKNASTIRLNRINPLIKLFLAFGLLALIAGLYELMNFILSGLVLNSSIPLKFDHILELSLYSFAGLLVIAATLFAFWFLFESAARRARDLCSRGWHFILVSGLAVAAYAGFHSLSGTADIVRISILCLLLLLIYLRKRPVKNINRISGTLIPFLLILSILATYQLHRYTVEREHEQRKILASHLSDSRDKLAEFYFKTAADEISADPKIAGLIKGKGTDPGSETDAVKYITKKYFPGFWSKYHIQITVCSRGKKLKVKPDNLVTECDDYFNNQIRQYLQPVNSNGLYFLSQSVDETYYLGKINIRPEGQDTSRPCKIYVEITSKNASRGLGYPELLMDKSLPSSENLTGYSYAFYYQGELVRNVGKYFYDIENEKYNNAGTGFRFSSQNNYTHLVHGIDAKTTLIISQEKPGTADVVAPFSFIFLFLLLFLLLLLLLAGKPYNLSFSTVTFRLRLQVFMVAIILGSSVIIGGITLLYLNQLNYSKNKDIVSEKMNTVQVELENRFGNSAELKSSFKDELDDQLLNLSNTNFTDINVFGPDGMLLSSSRNQIFDEGLISGLMNPEGMYNMIHVKKSFFIHPEKIGEYQFLSAYAPLRNFDNKVIGYLNLPYFARQEDLRQEVSRLLAAYANIYILMMAVAVLLALLLSRYITRPLQLIREQLGNVQLGQVNARVEWKRKDEIGNLVAEYNRMIDELSRSAELLARSERESAWREMAKQVAHEIKNPLTPIKLSMQHLMKAWDDRTPDWDARLKRFSQTLVMQIDTLSAIASEFSDFAQMPASNFKRIDLQPLLTHSIGLFKNLDNIHIHFVANPGYYFVNADENQMVRVFNNLIKNSVQAIPSDRQGKIDIEMKQQDKACLISFADNGSGIPTDQQTRIFSPNFTTKSAGMGLGLAMVKNIIDNSGGKVWFDSAEGSGTTFFILLPVASEPLQTAP